MHMTIKSSLLRTIRGASLITIVFAAGAAPYALAADLTQWSAPASGADMWTGIMARQGLYAPHPNDCTGGDVFVQVFTDQYGVNLGFCMEANERVGTDTFTGARATCLAANKRLPEPGEYHYACVNGAGINDLQDDWEWASNFSVNALNDANGREGVSVPIMGNGSCVHATTGWFASSDATESIVNYRCVR
jgi:hypothetical protein